MAKELYKTITGLTDSSIKAENGTLLVLPTASGAVFNPGVTMQEVMAMSRIGERVIVDTYPLERKPTIQLDYNQKNIQLLSMRMGLDFETETSADAKLVHNGFLVTKNSYDGAVSGNEGFGLTADQTGSIAYYLSPNGKPVALTRQPFATFDPETTLSFAQGANGATQWSDDLIGKYVAYEFPHSLTSVLKLSETPFTNFSMTLMTIMRDRSILQWNFPSVTIKLDQGDINLAEAQMQLQFQIQDDGSSCLPFDIIYKGTAQTRRCV